MNEAARRSVLIIGNARSVHLRRWAEALAAAGWCITVLGATRYKSPHFESLAWTSYEGGPIGSMIHWPQQFREFRSLLSSGRYDLVWVHGVNQGIRLCMLRGAQPLVVTVYGTDVIPHGGRHPVAFLHTAIARSVLSKATAITAASDYLARFTESRFPAVHGKATVVPFGVDTAVFRPRTLDDPPAEATALLFAKHLKPIYGLETLLQAVRLLRAQGLEFKLLIAGDGNTYSYERLATELGVRDAVVFLGQLDHERLSEVMRSAAIFVMPTIVRESFGVAALEAGAAGLPVVASRIGAIPDVVQDGETGLLFEPGDAEDLAEKVGHMLRNPDAAAGMGANGRKRVSECYGWESSVESMIAVLEAALHRAEAR